MTTTKIVKILDNMKEFVIFFEKPNVISWANGTAINSIGVELGEIIGNSCYGLWGKTEPCNNCPVAKAWGNGEINHSEIIDTTGDVFSIKAVPLIEKGCVRGVLEFRENITKQKNTSKDLKRERDMVQNYLNVARVILLVIGIDQKVKMINNKGCSILGYDKESILEKNWFDHFLPSNIREIFRSKFKEIIGKNLKEPDRVFKANNEHPVLAADGKEKIIAWNNVSLMDDNGKLIGVMSSGEDVTQKNMAEMERNEYIEDLKNLSKISMSLNEMDHSKEIYSFICNNLRDLIGNGIIIVTSYEYESKMLKIEDICGLGKNRGLIFDLLGNIISKKIIIPEDKAFRGLKSGGIRESSLDLHRISYGTVPKNMAGAIQKKLNITKIYGIGLVRKNRIYGEIAILLQDGHDIKNKDIIEIFIKQASIALQKKHIHDKLIMKNNELENFTSSLFHEIQSPLATIGGYLTILEEATEAHDCNEVKKCSDIIRNAAIEMSEKSKLLGSSLRDTPTEED